MAEFRSLEEAVEIVAEGDLGLVALGLGSGDSEEHDTLRGCLKIELSRRLLERIKKTKGRMEQGEWLRGEAREMVERWKGSGNEWVRLIAWVENGGS